MYPLYLLKRWRVRHVVAAHLDTWTEGHGKMIWPQGDFKEVIICFIRNRLKTDDERRWSHIYWRNDAS